MFNRIIEMFPETWQGPLELILAPVAWIPAMQRHLLEFFLESSSGWQAALKLLFLLPPVFLLIAAVWSTQLAVYTVPFRSRRIPFISLLLIAWWDGARTVWMYWTGLIRFLAVAVGWVFSLGRFALKLAAETVRQVVMAPARMTGRMTQSYFQPGVPWIAFLMLILWSALEALIFTYILFPTVSEVLADLIGVEPSPLTGTVLYLFLFMLILGSFACLQVFLEAIRAREIKFIIQMVVVELFVMFFEVLFLYREFVDAIIPWIAQQTGGKVQMGIVFTLSMATFGWVGIRGMTWFLFGQFGTPPLLAFISRQPMNHPIQTVPEAAIAEPTNWWRRPAEDLKQEIGWLHEKSHELLEYLSLPALHVLGASLNFAMILVTAKPVFSLPFKSLKEIMETREILALNHLQPRKVQS